MSAKKHTDDNEMLRAHESQKKQGNQVGPPGRRGPGPMMYKEKPKNTWGTLKRLIKYIGKSKYLLLALLCVMVLISFRVKPSTI